jgi:DNA invertase Pin-like site-specific DNA recombinase
MAGLVYSYLRFSDPKQATGTSSERQAAYAARWAAEHGLQLDETLSLRDEGLSAFHQTHVRRGALGAFLAAMDAGKVPKESVLVVEALDRLSRAEVLDAQAQLISIINAGISVVTASDNKVYSRDRLRENPMDLIYSLLVMQRAYEESATKSKRVTAAIVNRCKGWAAGTWRGKLRNGKDPAWVRETADGWELIPDRAEAVREAVRLYRAGQSGKRIVEKLASTGAASVATQATHLYKVLKNPALVGIKRIAAGGEEFDLAGYYPPVISTEEWSELQAAGDGRPRRGGRTGAGDIPHVVTGIGVTYCGYCGCAMSGQNLFGKLKKRGDKLKPGYRRLLCAGQQYASGRCAHPKSRSVAPLERALMNYCSDVINLRGLYDGDRAQPLRAELAKLRAKSVTIAEQLDRLTAAMLAVDASETPQAFARKARELEVEQAAVAREISTAEHMISSLARSDVDGAEARWQALAKGVLELDVDARLQARQLVADTFERITVYASGQRPGYDPDDIIDVTLKAKGGAWRVLRIDKAGNWVAGEAHTPDTAFMKQYPAGLLEAERKPFAPRSKAKPQAKADDFNAEPPLF